MENGAIPDESITASPSMGPVPPHFARLNGLLACCTGKTKDCYLQVRLLAILLGPIHARVHSRLLQTFAGVPATGKTSYARHFKEKQGKPKSLGRLMNVDFGKNI